MTYRLTVVVEEGGDKPRQTDRHRVVAVLHLVGIPAQPGHNSLQHSSEVRHVHFTTAFRIRINRINMFLDLPDPDPYIIKQKYLKYG
jgi:hypothetical protein